MAACQPSFLQKKREVQRRESFQAFVDLIKIPSRRSPRVSQESWQPRYSLARIAQLLISCEWKVFFSLIQFINHCMFSFEAVEAILLTLLQLQSPSSVLVERFARWKRRKTAFLVSLLHRSLLFSGGERGDDESKHFTATCKLFN